MSVAKDGSSQTTSPRVLIASCILIIQFLSAIDKYDIDGVVPLIQKNFNINDAQTGIIRKDVSDCCFAVDCPVYSVDSAGIAYIHGEADHNSALLQSFSQLFVGFRALGAACSALFEILIPVLLADMFKERALGIALMIMTGCELISGLVIGIASSWILSTGLPWQSGLIFGPLLSIVPLMILLCSGRSFRSVHRSEQRAESLSKSLLTAFGLFSIKSFLLVTAALSLGSFAVKGYTFWLPSMFLNAWTSTPEAFPGLSYTAITILNSTFIMAGYLAGLPPIQWFAQSWRHGTGLFSCTNGYTRAYPIVGATGAIIWTGSFIAYVSLVIESYAATLICIFLVGFGQAAQGSLAQLMLLTVVPTSSRASAVALKSLIGAIASTPSAQIVGMISDALRGESTLAIDSFYAYQRALLFSSILLIATSVCYLVLIAFFPKDCERAQEHDRAVENAKRERVDETTPLVGTSELRSHSSLNENVLFTHESFDSL